VQGDIGYRRREIIVSRAAAAQYLFAPIRYPERRAAYRSMRLLLVVGSFCFGMLGGSAVHAFF
jgi:hypothetical protein